MIKKLKYIFKLASEHIFFLTSTVLSAGVYFFYSVYVKIYLTPFEYGIYSTCLLFQSYMFYIQLGSLNSFNRDYPQLIGNENHKKSKSYRDSTFSFLIFAVINLILLNIVFLLVNNSNNSKLLYGIFLCSIITSASLIENFLESRVRIECGFKFTSFVIIFKLLSVFVGVFLIHRIGYYVLYIVPIGSSIIGIFFYYKKGLSDIHFSVDIKLIKTIVFSGIPLLINNLIWTLVNSIDKYVILWFIDIEALGLYSIAQMAFSYMMLIPNALSQLFYVNLGKIYGATKSTVKLNNTACVYSFFIAIFIGLLVIVSYYFIGPAVDFVIPNYSQGVKSAQIILLGLALYSPTFINGNILTILKKNTALLSGSIYLCIVNLFLSVFLVVIFGPTIENIAIGTVISYLIRTIILMFQLKRNAGYSMLSFIEMSIFPIFIIISPCLSFYYVLDNKLVGFCLSCIYAFLVIFFVFGKKLKGILQSKKY